MTAYLKLFLDICLLRKGPQDLPFSQALLFICMLLYLLSGVFSQLSVISLEVSVLSMVVDLVILLLFIGIILRAFTKSARYVQTMTAMTGVGTIFQLLAWPIISMLQSASADEQPQAALPLLLLIFMSWNLAVYAHIFRESFGVRLLSAFIITLAYAVIMITARQLLFPQAAA